jgi:hypothetical protein
MSSNENKICKNIFGKKFQFFSLVAGKREKKKRKRKTTTFMQMKKIL